MLYNDRIVLYNRYGYLTEQIGVSGHDKDTGGHSADICIHRAGHLVPFLKGADGFAFQPLGQKYVTAEAAAIFTVINPLTASAMGLLVASERVTVSKIIGYILILFALTLYNLDLGRLRKARQNG